MVVKRRINRNNKEKVMEFYERVLGVRLHANYIRPFGVSQDIPFGLLKNISLFIKKFKFGLEAIKKKFLKVPGYCGFIGRVSMMLSRNYNNNSIIASLGCIFFFLSALLHCVQL